MARTTYTAPISAEEKAEFVPFLNRLIDTAFDEIVPRFLTGIAVEDKTNGTPVTQADKTAEEKMRLLIEKTYPEHGIFGEEWGEKEVSHNSEGVRYRWILDPVDGTKSFITNSFLFGTLIALERDDGTGFRPILSSISHAAANVRTIGTLDGTHMHLETAARLWTAICMCGTAGGLKTPRFWRQVTGPRPSSTAQPTSRNSLTASGCTARWETASATLRWQVPGPTS